MGSPSTKLTIRLPTRDVDQATPSAALETITGLVPRDVDAEEAYRRHMMEKHGG